MCYCGCFIPYHSSHLGLKAQLTRLEQQLATERESHISELRLMEEAAGKRLQEAHLELQQATSERDILQQEVNELGEETARSQEQQQETSVSLSRVSEQLEELRQERWVVERLTVCTDSTVLISLSLMQECAGVRYGNTATLSVHPLTGDPVSPPASRCYPVGEHS